MEEHTFRVFSRLQLSDQTEYVIVVCHIRLIVVESNIVFSKNHTILLRELHKSGGPVRARIRTQMHRWRIERIVLVCWV